MYIKLALNPVGDRREDEASLFDFRFKSRVSILTVSEKADSLPHSLSQDPPQRRDARSSSAASCRLFAPIPSFQAEQFKVPLSTVVRSA